MSKVNSNRHPNSAGKKGRNKQQETTEECNQDNGFGFKLDKYVHA